MNGIFQKFENSRLFEEIRFVIIFFKFADWLNVQEIRADCPSKNGGAAPPFLKNGGALHPCTPANSPSDDCIKCK